MFYCTRLAACQTRKAADEAVICAGETVATDDSIRDVFFTTIYGLISESAQSGGPAQGSNFWNLYTVGIADDDPYKITLADNSTMSIVAMHVSHPPRRSHMPAPSSWQMLFMLRLCCC